MSGPKLAHSNPEEPALRQLHEELTELGRILPGREAPPPEPRSGAPRPEPDFSDVEDLFDNCPV